MIVGKRRMNKKPPGRHRRWAKNQRKESYEKEDLVKRFVYSDAVDHVIGSHGEGIQNQSHHRWIGDPAR